MKKIVAVSFLFLLFLASGCKGTKYCPTYSQDVEKQPVTIEKDIKS